jgi:hypothetical protein
VYWALKDTKQSGVKDHVIPPPSGSSQTTPFEL